MSRDEDRRAIERFIAGLPVDAEALTTALTAKAVDRAIVVEALLMGLSSPEPGVRRRVARRIVRMPDVDPSVEARLTVLAASDDDARSRTASAEALRAHGRPVPGEPPPHDPRERTRAPLLLHLRPSYTRSRSDAQRGITVLPISREEARDFVGRVHDEGEGQVRFELTGLPEPFEGHRPLLQARLEPDGETLTTIARAETPVTGGQVTIRAPLEGDLAELLARGVALVADAD